MIFVFYAYNYKIYFLLVWSVCYLILRNVQFFTVLLY